MCAYAVHVARETRKNRMRARERERERERESTRERERERERKRKRESTREHERERGARAREYERAKYSVGFILMQESSPCLCQFPNEGCPPNNQINNTRSTLRTWPPCSNKSTQTRVVEQGIITFTLWRTSKRSWPFDSAFIFIVMSHNDES